VSVKFHMAEILVAGSVVLLTAGITTPGWVFFGCGLFLGFARFSMENHEKAKLSQDIDNSLETIKESFPAFLEGLSTISNAGKNNTKKSSGGIH